MKIFSKKTSAGDEQVLIDAFRKTRSEADFRRLYQAHTPALYQFVMRLVGGMVQDAEEVVQDTWVRAIEKIDSFRKEAAFRTWLSAIAVNRSRELYRQRRKTASQISTEEAVLPEIQPPVTASDRMDLDRAIAALSEGYRQVLVLHDVEGYTHQEISEFLNINIGTSKSQLFHARRAVRKYFQAEDI